MEKRFLRGFFAVFLVLTLLFAGVVYVVDPWYHYHGPWGNLPLCLRDGRYQNDGAARHLSYDTLLLGTSVTANFRAEDMDRYTGGTTQKLIVQGGYFQDFYGPLDAALATHSVEQVYWGVDSNCFRRYDSESTWQAPSYLFDRNPFNDVKYLLNKDMMFWDLTEVLERAAEGNRQDEQTGGYTWGEDQEWSRRMALGCYHRPEVRAEQQPKDAFLGPTEENLRNVLQRVDAHPQVTFTFYLAPYSILFWDDAIRTGELDATLEMHRVILEELTTRENTRVFYFMDNTQRITDLDNYCDYIHYSPEVCRQLAEEMVTGTPVTRAEIGPRLEAFRSFLTTYNYGSLFA